MFWNTVICHLDFDLESHWFKSQFWRLIGRYVVFLVSNMQVPYVRLRPFPFTSLVVRYSSTVLSCSMIILVLENVELTKNQQNNL